MLNTRIWASERLPIILRIVSPVRLRDHLDAGAHDGVIVNQHDANHGVTGLSVR